MNLVDIKQHFDVDLAKKILAKKDNAISFLQSIKADEGIHKNTPSARIWALVVEKWNYETALPIIREMFKETKKYKNGKGANSAVKALREEWQKLNLGDFQWPFSQSDFDGFVQRINALDETGLIKDDRVKAAAVKFRRIKEINTYRNDYIETLIFETSDSILPTLRHSRGVDFFINGVSYDQKVSRSVTNQFKSAYGEQWRKAAIDNPEKVAEYLYSYQDEGRFDDNPRLLVVYLDEDILVDRIETIIKETDFNKPHRVSFTFKHKNGGNKTYQTNSIVILLHN